MGTKKTAPKKSAEVQTNDGKEPVTEVIEDAPVIVESVVEDKAPDTPIVDAPNTQEGGNGGDTLDSQDSAIDLDTENQPSLGEPIVESEVINLFLESEKDLLGIDFPATFTISNTKPTRLVIDKTRHYVEPYSVKDVGVDNANVAKSILECVKRNNKVLATPITVSLK